MPDVANAHYYIEGGDTSLEKKYSGRLGHRTYFIDGRNNWGGDTAHNCKKKGRLTVAECMSWLVNFEGYELAGSVSDYSTTLWLHLAS